MVIQLWICKFCEKMIVGENKRYLSHLGWHKGKVKKDYREGELGIEECLKKIIAIEKEEKKVHETHDREF